VPLLFSKPFSVQAAVLLEPATKIRVVVSGYSSLSHIQGVFIDWSTILLQGTSTSKLAYKVFMHLILASMKIFRLDLRADITYIELQLENVDRRICDLGRLHGHRSTKNAQM
jgi:hypothetical protein